jgi:hypothetical protein
MLLACFVLHFLISHIRLLLPTFTNGNLIAQPGLKKFHDGWISFFVLRYLVHKLNCFLCSVKICMLIHMFIKVLRFRFFLTFEECN